ncbi:hypothetical protein N657DRAFT_650566 [Parathielavia appendiculata]|uniref:Uncharacterized protein n=1 Tax=Parathielavia appendiculata TaxID=2587402 RepID=A0AAN6TR56_9PEZI|nr:hypothetical protein N657DRAFT_650566 [Parathielavia appendiculata]
MPSFTNRRNVPDRFRPLSKPEDGLMEDMNQTTPAAKDGSSLTLGPSDGSLLDYFDLPSPPSTPQRPTHSLAFSSLAGLSSPATSPVPSLRSSPIGLSTPSSISSGASPNSSPPMTTLPRWPTASQRIHRRPIRPRSRSASSVSSSSSSLTSSSTPVVDADVDMIGTDTTGLPGGAGGTTGIPPLIRSTRMTPYYPPNSSRNVDRARVYMNRGPHYIPNWTPMSSLPRHVQLQIEERLMKFTAI